jgi:hypothetical protein
VDVPVTPFLTREQLGERLHVRTRTLANWAVRGEGPNYRVLGGRVLYRLIDVEAWEQEQWGAESRLDPHRQSLNDRADHQRRFAREAYVDRPGAAPRGVTQRE